MPVSIWSILGIEPTNDREVIRLAYSRRLKLTNPEANAEGFQALRAAYESALHHARFILGAAAVAAFSEGLPLEAERPAETAPIPDLGIGKQDDSEIENRFAALSSLLGVSDQHTAETLNVALAELLKAPGLDDLIAYASMEQRVAELIIACAPRSDPLIGYAIEAFHWRRERIGAIAPGAGDVLSRDEDLRFWKPHASRLHPDHVAYLALTRQRSVWRSRLNALTKPRLAHQVRQLLASIDYTHRSLGDQLDPSAEAWWRGYLNAPRFPGWSGHAAIVVALLSAFVAVIGWPDLAPWRFPLVGLGGAGASLLAIGVFLWAVAKPRHWWLTHRSWRAPAWERLGWEPLSWTLILFSAFGTTNPPITAMVSVLALCAGLWGVIVGELDPRMSRRADWLMLTAFLQIPLVGWWVVVAVFTPMARPIALTVAIGSAVAASAVGGGGLINAYQSDLSPRLRFSAQMALLALGLAASVAVWAYGLGRLSAPTMTALAVTFVLAHRPLTAWLSPEQAKLRYRLSYYSLIPLLPMTAYFGVTLAMGATVWLLAGAWLGVILALVRS